MPHRKEKPKRSKLKLVGKLIIGGAVGSIIALALGTKKGRETSQRIYEGIKERIDEIVPLNEEDKK